MCTTALAELRQATKRWLMATREEQPACTAAPRPLGGWRRPSLELLLQAESGGGLLIHG